MKYFGVAGMRVKCFGVAGRARDWGGLGGPPPFKGTTSTPGAGVGGFGGSPPFEGATSTPWAAGDEIGVGTIAGDRGLSRAVVVVVVVVCLSVPRRTSPGSLIRS